MSEISSKDIKKILEVVEEALIVHTKWHEGMIRSLLCKTHVPESYIAEDAHHKCDFGCWFYAENNSDFQRLPVANKIRDTHKIMHESARVIFLKMEANGMVPEKDYDNFIRNLSHFKEELTNLRQRILDTLESVSAK